MHAYYFIYLIIILGVFFLLVRYFIVKKTSLATRFFIEATRAENNGNFQEAIIAFENALREVKKVRFHPHLKIRIIEKLKILRTIKTYKKDQGFVRENNSWIS
jgi:hypothetical protein